MPQCPGCGTPLTGGDRWCPACQARAASSASTRTPAILEQSTTPALEAVDSNTALAHGALLLDRYRVIELVGRGGMGEVYRATDTVLGQTVALKVLPVKVSSDARRRARLLEEVKNARRVSHPNVCRVHDVGEAGGRLFVSMEYIDGEDLAVLLRRIGRLAGAKALEIARQITAGLAAAHAAGILHRDLKPANVMLDRNGHVRLTDFGLAAPSAEAPGELAGTPAYMAPEQLAGARCSERTDLYALGLLLYELFTGVQVFAGRTLDELRAAQVVPPPLPSAVVHDLEREIEVATMQCLERDPDRRPSSALEVLTVLSGGDPIGAALVAGQTPSRLAVASAPVGGAIRPVVAWCCAATIALSATVCATLGARVSILEQSRLELPPQALAARAREVLARLGYPGPWKDEAWGFHYDRAARRFLLDGRRLDRLAAARPAAIVFWYRASPRVLVSGSAEWQGARVDLDDPPLTTGMVSAVLDPRGRLLRLSGRPTTDAGPLEVAPPALLQLAELDPRQLRPDRPSPPPSYADDLLAWRGDAEPHDVRVELARLEGRPVHFRVAGLWDRPAEAEEAAPSAAFGAAYAMELLTLLALIAALLLAIDNLRSGRGDRRGALRLAVWCFGLYLASRLIGADHRPLFSAEEALVVSLIQRSLYVGASAWLLYVALEPHVRRVWAGRLVSWARLLEGRWTDPLVARDVLLGTVVASATAALIVLVENAMPGGPSLAGFEYRLEALLGPRHSLAAMLHASVWAVHSSLVVLALSFLFRSLPLRPAATTALLALVLGGSLFGSVYSTGWTDLFLAVVLVVSWLLLLARVGFLAMLTAVVLEYFAARLPNATRLTGWHSDPAWLIWLLAVTLAAWGIGYATRAQYPRCRR